MSGIGAFPELFRRFCEATVRRLPGGLGVRVAPSLVGFAVINGFTFAVDLGLLTLTHGVAGWPLWLSITASYAGALALGFVLNRWLNFRSRRHVGRQAGLYLCVITVNYLALVLGVGNGLVGLGVQYHLARIVAGACEVVFLYCAMRWVVFVPAGGRYWRSSAS